MPDINVTGSLGGGLTRDQKLAINSKMQKQGFKNFNIDEHSSYGSNNKTKINLGASGYGQGNKMATALSATVQGVTGKSMGNMKYRFAAPSTAQPAVANVPGQPNIADQQTTKLNIATPQQTTTPQDVVPQQALQPMGNPAIASDVGGNEFGLPTARQSEIMGGVAQPKRAFEPNPNGSHEGLSGTALLNQIQKELDSPAGGNQVNDISVATTRSIEDLVNGTNDENVK